MSNYDNEIIKDSINALKNVREKIPLTNCITNYVTINDCANAVLAIGGSPVMSDDPREIEKFVEIANALVINLGAINPNQIEAMIIGSQYGTETKTPIVLDPVGVGVTELRNTLTLKLIEESDIAAIRGNMSEIKDIARLIDLNEIKSTTQNISKGVDASIDDKITKENLKINGKIVAGLAKELNTVIIASGAIDIISNGKSTYACENGDSLMPKITGSGCMLTSIVGSFCGVNEPLIAALSATLAMGIAGGEAGKFVKKENSGTGTFRAKLIDYLSNMDDELLLKEAKLYKLKID